MQSIFGVDSIASLHQKHSNMKKTAKALTLLPMIAIILLSSCSSYTLTSVKRELLVVDSRYDASPDSGALKFIAPYKHKVDSASNPVVGESTCHMSAKRPEGTLSNLLPDILIYAAKDYGEHPDFGVYNIGGIRASLGKGKVTYGDVVDIAPFENKICFITLTGEKVLELFSQIAHRGGECVSHGVQLIITPDGTLLDAKLHGRDIDPKATYRITTIDYLVQGNDGLTAFKDGTDLNSPQDEKNNARYVIANYFRSMAKQGKAVASEIEGRIVVHKVPKYCPICN